MNPSTAFATVLVDELARHGLGDACIAPGSRSAPLAMALHRDDRVRLHVRIDERSAGFLALGAARAGGRPVVVACTSGTAAANLHPAVIEASQSHVPLLVLTADRPPELRGTGANQTIDQVGLYGGAVRWFCEVGVPEAREGSVAYWRSLASRAWAEAAGLLGGSPGPVHLNLALREPLVPTDSPPFPEALDGRPVGAPWTRVTQGRRQPAASDIEELAALVERTERGVIVAGDGANAGQPLEDLARVAGWPVLAEPSSGARTGHAISTYASLLADPDVADALRPEVALVVGRVGLARPLLALLGSGIGQVRVDPHGAWSDPTRSTGRLIVADAGLLCAQVAAAVRPRGPTTWTERWGRAEDAGRSALDRLLDAEEAPSEPRTARDLAAALPDGAVLSVGSSMPVRDLDTTMAPRSGLRVLAGRGASGIDGFASTALGAALTHPGPAFGLCGDLTLLHDQNGLLAGPTPPDLVLVVVNNDGGGIFSFLPQADFPDQFEPLFGTPHGLDLSQIAAAAGCGHRRLDWAADLAAAVDDARVAGGIQLVEVRTDRAQNRDLHDRLRAAITAAALRTLARGRSR